MDARVTRGFIDGQRIRQRVAGTGDTSVPERESLTVL